MTDSVQIGNCVVGESSPPIFMAEIGTFFNKDMDKAKRLLDQITRAGADLLKTEILHSPEVCLKGTGLEHKYNHASGSQVEDYRALVERKVVSLEAYAQLFDICKQRGLPFVASVYDVEGVDFLVDQGAAALKLARDNVNNIPLLRYCAKTGLPVILDAGGLFLDEVGFAVRLIEKENGKVIVNHHPAMNPAPFEAHNLNIISTYQKAFRIPVGLSCHFRGDEMIYLAVALGARLIEKGVFDNPYAIEQDVVSALDVRKLDGVIQKMRNCWQALGDGIPRVAEPRDVSTWKGLVAKTDINQGQVLGMENLGFAWPPVGISVSHWDIVEGRRAAKDIKKNIPVTWDLVENS